MSAPRTAPPIRTATTSSRPPRARLALAVAASLAAVGAGAPAASALSPAPPAKPPHVIQTDGDGFVSRLGPVRVNTRTSNLSNAYRAFGRPTSEVGRRTVRRVRWKAAGVSIVATTFGACRRRRCATKELLVQTSRVDGPRWQTAAGLRVGDPVARIVELYPAADPPASGSGTEVLTTAETPFGDGGDVPIVTARVRGGVVSAFDVVVGAAGE